MPTTQTMFQFAAAALVLMLIPGPAVLFITGRSIQYGWRSGVRSAQAVAAGNLVHVLAAVAGLTAILAASATAFTVIKYAGAAYLLWLAIGAFRESLKHQSPNDSHGSVEAVSQVQAPPTGALVRDGFMVAVFNPKTALFFLAFLPQFVDPTLGSVPIQVAILGLTLVGLGLITDTSYALVAGHLGGVLRGSARSRRIQAAVAGTMYGALAVVAVRTHRVTT